MRLTDCWRYGYKKVTVDDLAQEVGIGEGTIYLHFRSKDEIVLSHVDRIVHRVLELQAIRVLAFIDHDVAKPFPLPLPHICVLARQLHREQQELVEFNCGLGFWVFGGAFTRQDFAVLSLRSRSSCGASGPRRSASGRRADRSVTRSGRA